MTKTPYHSVNDERLEQLIRWLHSNDIAYDRLVPASVDAGFRRYFRLFTKNETKNETLIAVDAPPAYENTERFITIANRLRKGGLNTPHVHCYSLEKGFMLLDDFGSSHFQSIINSFDYADDSQGYSKALYKRAMNTLIQIQHRIDTTDLEPYDRSFLKRELDLYPEWYLQRHHGHSLSSEQLEIINRTFDVLISNALEQPIVFVHRDYHCRNLMVIQDGEIGIIDFQDAVAGPVTYDAVSLLRDAYIEWPNEFQHRLMEQHRKSLCPVPEPATYCRWFDLMGLQRHLKILGIFCRLYYRDGKSHYLDDVPLVQHHIQSTLQRYPEFSAFATLFQRLQKPEHLA